MIFYEGQEIRPKNVGGGGFMGGIDLLGAVGGPMHETEYWNCYFCGKVRAVRQWKRARVLEDQGEPKDPELGTWSPDQLRSVDGKDLLPDGWDFHKQKFEHQGQQYKLLMLGCAECLAEGDDTDDEEVLETKEKDGDA